MEKAGLNDMALYIKYTSDDLSVWDEYKYLNEGAKNTIMGIATRKTVNVITIFVPDGVVRTSWFVVG